MYGTGAEKHLFPGVQVDMDARDQEENQVRQEALFLPEPRHFLFLQVQVRGTRWEVEKKRDSR